MTVLKVLDRRQLDLFQVLGDVPPLIQKFETEEASSLSADRWFAVHAFDILQ